MKEAGRFVRVPYETEFVGQGVSLQFNKEVSENGLRIKSDITDGNGSYMGRVDLIEKDKVLYVDVKKIDLLKKTTIVNLIKTIAESFEYALRDEVAAEAEPAPAQVQEPEEPEGDPAGSDDESE